MDAVQQANSGHPGTPMALAPLVYTIWQQFLRFDPDDPIWPNRDRFVLSNGHASMLLYSLLHLTDVKAVNAEYERLGEPAVTLDDIKQFRQLGSKCPGHPEYHLTSGVETTTGPLGQGCGDSVGIRVLIHDRKRVTTCLGFGPRFLHSTRQAYKGGPNTGVFLQITCDDLTDVQVPDQKYTFGIVKAAEARSD